MYNITARSRSLYFSLAVLYAWQHFTRTQRFYGDVAGKNKAYLDLQVKCPILVKYEISRFIFIKLPRIKFHIDPFSRSRGWADVCGGADVQTEGRTGLQHFSRKERERESYCSDWMSPSTTRRADTCGQTEMTTIIKAFRDYAEEPNK